MRQERRRHPRSKAEQGFVITCYSAEFQGRTSEHYNLANRILDLSKKGVCLVTVGRLREGLSVIIDLAIPNTRTQFKARAVVRWSQTVESKGPVPRTAHVAGLEFERVLEAFGEKVAPLAGGRAVGLPLTREPRRAHKRFVPQQVDIICIPRGLMTALGFGTNVARRLRDLSLGGAQIVSPKKLKPGQVVSLRMEFKNPRSLIEAKGVIRWCHRDTLSVEPRWYAGVIFRDMPSDSQMNLRALEKFFLGGRVTS